MDDLSSTHTTTQPEPAKASGGFPPFDQTTFPSQIFWLVIAMALLFVVLWRFAGPRIKSTIEERRALIAQEMKTAQENRQQAEKASAAYDTPMLEARERARSIAREAREHAVADVQRAEAEAEANAEKATAEAEARLAKMRTDAKAQITQIAQGAAAEIVARLTGETVSADDAAAAVRATQV